LLCTNVRTLFGTASGAVGLQTGYGKANCAAPSSITYSTPGTYTWTAPAGVNNVSVVAVGGGGGGTSYAGGGGGGLAFSNNTATTPGTGYTVVVGSPGTRRSCKTITSGPYGLVSNIGYSGDGGTSSFGSNTYAYGGQGNKFICPRSRNVEGYHILVAGYGGSYSSTSGGARGGYSTVFCNPSTYLLTGGGGAGGYGGTCSCWSFSNYTYCINNPSNVQYRRGRGGNSTAPPYPYNQIFQGVNCVYGAGGAAGSSIPQTNYGYVAGFAGSGGGGVGVRYGMCWGCPGSGTGANVNCYTNGTTLIKAQMWNYYQSGPGINGGMPGSRGQHGGYFGNQAFVGGSYNGPCWYYCAATVVCCRVRTCGGAYGGGGGSGSPTEIVYWCIGSYCSYNHTTPSFSGCKTTGGAGGGGAVRIMWPGSSRSFGNSGGSTQKGP
jgi:hypothetical protein